MSSHEAEIMSMCHLNSTALVSRASLEQSRASVSFFRKCRQKSPSEFIACQLN
jgi:hypothetical protein